MFDDAVAATADDCGDSIRSMLRLLLLLAIALISIHSLLRLLLLLVIAVIRRLYTIQYLTSLDRIFVGIRDILS